jgi:hypothetical protein
MRRVLTVVISCGVLGVAVFGGPSAASAANCGNYAGGAVITKGDVNCRKAKAIVKEFLKVRKSRIQGFNCKGSSTRVSCKSGDKQITWKKG